MKQIVIVTENRPGVVAKISELLGKKGINIESINADAVGNYGVITLMVDRVDLAVALLKDASYDAKVEDALVVNLHDEPGALAVLSRRFLDADINIRSIRIVRRGEGSTLVAIATNRTHEAMDLVKDLLHE
ncbi:MAG: ACT domain-containing protein [Verrucomicrobiota bacterium]|nr:ACT domain-containing protein [Verrucomicrobiota bacterium]